MLLVHPLLYHHHNIDLLDNELVLNTRITFVPEHRVIQRIKVTCDWYTGEGIEDPTPDLQGKNRKKNFPKHGAYEASIVRGFVVRKAIDWSDDDDQPSVIPMRHTHPIRAELEIATYGRKFFEIWDRQPVLSCPITIFIDGFGLYRNTYKSLAGVYATLAGLNGKDRHRQANIIPLALSPHGSNFDESVKTLQSIRDRVQGVVVDLGDFKGVLCVPVLCHIGDMPQQDKNSSFRGPKANKFCRQCFIGRKALQAGNPSDILDFDIVTHGRFHRQTIQMRLHMDEGFKKWCRQESIWHSMGYQRG